MVQLVLVGLLAALVPIALIITIYAKAESHVMLKQLYVAKETVGRYGAVYEHRTEALLGHVVTGSSQIILGEEPNTQSTRGDPVLTAISFYEIGIPRGSTVIQSRVRLEVDAVDVSQATLQITVEKGEDPPRLTNVNGEVSARPTVNFTDSPVPTHVEWKPQPWNLPHVFRYMPCVGEGSKSQAPPRCGDGGVSLNPLVQRTVNQHGWRKNHDIVFIVSGTGTRRAQSSKNQALGPELQVRVYVPGVEVSPSIFADLHIRAEFPDGDDWENPSSKPRQRYLTHIILCTIVGKF